MQLVRIRRYSAACLLATVPLAAACSSDTGTPTPPVLAPLTAPREPAFGARSLVDAPYLQEYNHPLLDDDPAREPVVAIVMPPAALHPFAEPLPVKPRGIARSDAPMGSALTLPAGEPDVIAAAVSTHEVVVTSSTTVHRHDGTAWSAHPAPAGMGVLGVAPGGLRTFVIATDGLHLLPEGEPVDWATTVPGATAALETIDSVWVATTSSIARYNVGTPSALGRKLWDLALPAGIGRPVALVASVSVPENIDLVVIGDAGIAGLEAPLGGAASWLDVEAFAPNRVPFVGARSAIRLADGGFVVATGEGAMRMMQRGDGPEWRVYNLERWLPSKDVRGVAAVPSAVEGPLWFATALGVAQVTARRVTVEEKLTPFVDRIVRRHDRDGAVADSHLTKRGDVTSNIPWDSDNDGSWTSYWLRGECYRWKVTNDPEAKAHFDRALDAMLRLRDVTGTDYFLARAVIRKEGCQLDDCDDPDDGKWFTSPDGVWWVKRDTSNDEVIAHIGMMGQAYDLCADEAQKQRIRDHVAGVIGGIMDHGWQLIDPVTNEVTTYGQFDPGYVNDGLQGAFGDGGVRSAEILAGLTLAYYLTGERRFLDGKTELVTKFHYADNAERELQYPVRITNQDNDEMAVWAWMVLNRYEPDPELYARWKAGWQKNWDLKFKYQQAAWWNMVHAVNQGNELELETTLRWLRLAPVDMVRWSLLNSNRRDLVDAGSAFGDGKKKRSDGRIIPYDERPNDRWNTDQFKVDGGMNGTIEMDGADVLEPYWMARYYGWLTHG